MRNEDKGRTLYLNGPIAEETWWGDEATPKAFKDDLLDGDGDVIVWLNSPGGDVFAATQIYNMLKEYPGKVTVRVDALAASAASVVAMAGDEVCMSPVAQMMIHDPMTIAIGGTDEMDKAKAMLEEVKEGIINAYQLKTGLSSAKLSHMMSAETWMNAKKAVELKFADKILYAEGDPPDDEEDGLIFSRAAVSNSLLSKLPKPQTPLGTPIESLEKRLELLSH